jgi:hypothetical protein
MYKLNNNKFKSVFLFTTFLGNSFLSLANPKKSEKKVPFEITSKENPLSEKQKIKIFKGLKKEDFFNLQEQFEKLKEINKICLEELKNQQEEIKKDKEELSSNREKILYLQNIISEKENYIKDLDQKIYDSKNIEEITVEELKEIVKKKEIEFENIYFTVQTSSFKKYTDAIKHEGELRKKNFKAYITAKYDTKEGIRVEIPIKKNLVIEKKVKLNAKPVANKSSK